MSIKEPIIFVEDDADDRYIYQEIFERLGISDRLRFFKEGKELLGYLQKTSDKPLIIFCDINMPRMDGLQLRRHLNDDEKLRRKSIPFVFFSTAATIDQVKEAYDLTVQGFFVKEHNFSETQTTLKMIIDYWSKCKHPNSSNQK